MNGPRVQKTERILQAEKQKSITTASALKESPLDKTHRAVINAPHRINHSFSSYTYRPSLVTYLNMLGQHAQIILSLMALSAVGFSSPLSSSSGSVMPENNVYRRQLGPVTVEPISGFSSDKKARDEVPEATVSRRQLGPVVTDPIPSFTPSRLKARDAVQNLEARSSMGGCGGNTWAPVSAYLQAVDEFCQTIQGTTVQHGMQQSASYGAIALTGNLGYGHAVCKSSQRLGTSKMYYHFGEPISLTVCSDLQKQDRQAWLASGLPNVRDGSHDGVFSR